MNNTLHTPGHWKKEGATILQDITNQEVCKMLGKNEEIQNANAHLISAAPDLLSTLQDICAMIVSPNDTRADILAHARAAIAKAEGKTK